MGHPDGGDVGVRRLRNPNGQHPGSAKHHDCYHDSDVYSVVPSMYALSVFLSFFNAHSLTHITFPGVNAFDYMILARLIWFFVPGRRIGIFKPSILAVMFVALDVGAFIIQLIGGGMAAVGNPPDQIQKGLHIYMAGMGLQQFFICLFLVIAVQFHRQMLQQRHMGQLVGLKAKWRRLLYALYASLTFITVRIIFRLVEFSSGNTPNNPVITNEWYLYVFDATPMLLAILVWNVVHPGTVLQGPDAKMPPSALRKILFSCCGKRKNTMQKIPDEDPIGGDQTMLLHERARLSSYHS